MNMQLHNHSHQARSMASSPEPPRLKLKRKRKRGDAEQQDEAKRPKPDTKPFRFFDLPGELRNMVYQEVAQQQTAVLKKGKLTDSSGLLDVAETRNEYEPILLLHATTIDVDVQNFDFRHLVTFINRLSEAELKGLATLSQLNSRSIDITLNFTRNPHEGSPRKATVDQKLLARWLNRAGHPSKKDTTLDVSYTLGSVQRDDEGRYLGLYSSRRSAIVDWIVDVHEYTRTTSKERSHQEAKKMLNALTG